MRQLVGAFFYEMLDPALQMFGSYESYKEDGSIADIIAPAEIANILKPGLGYLNFNYTEFLESLYDVPHEKITYIHDCRRNPKDILVIGHAEDDYIEEHKEFFMILKFLYMCF